MITILEKIISFITLKEVYGLFLIIILSTVVYRIISKSLEKALNTGKTAYEKKKRTTIAKLFQNIAKYLIIIIAGISILSLYGFDVKGMIAGLGIAATIIGLALQDTFKDIINGISIIFENYFVVGDVVKYNNFTGEVIEFGLKSTKIKNVNGEVLTVANRNIMEITNVSQKDQTVVLLLGMKYEDNVDKVEKVIINDIIPAIQAMESVNENSCEYLGISELADSCVKYQIKFVCEKETQWQAKRDANKIVLKEMRRHNLSFAYPQMEVHNGK